MSSTSPSIPSLTPTPPSSPPAPPPPPVYSVNVLHFLSLVYPALTNPLTLLQARSVTHSLFTPTYLSPLHPLSAVSQTHPTYPLHLSPLSSTLRSLISREGLRSLTRGLSPAVLGSLIRASILSYEGAYTADPDDPAPPPSPTPPTSSSPFPSSPPTPPTSTLNINIDLYLPWMTPQLIPLAVFAAYPFDQLRTLLQLHQHNYVALPSPTAMGDWHVVERRPTLWGLMSKVVREGGVTALWRGVTPALVGQSALMWVAMRTVEEASAVSEAAYDPGADDPSSLSSASSPAPAADHEGQDPAIGFPLTLIDRIAWLTWPYSPASLGLLLSTYLLVHYPLSVLSLHMRAATFAAPHVSVQPMTPPPYPPGSHHLQMVGGMAWTRVGEGGGRVGVVDVLRRLVERDGWGGLWRGLRWSAYKMTLIGLGVTAFSWWAAEWEEGDDGGDE